VPQIVRDFIPSITAPAWSPISTVVLPSKVAKSIRRRFVTRAAPRSKESAIVMLADSCEALVRASQQDDRARRASTSSSTAFRRASAEGQLDDCDVTMRELQEVAASFKSTLRAIYHPRIEYPQPAPEEIAALARNAPPADSPRRSVL
jgi:hypothetical protein